MCFRMIYNRSILSIQTLAKIKGNARTETPATTFAMFMTDDVSVMNTCSWLSCGCVQTRRTGIICCTCADLVTEVNFLMPGT